MSCEPEKPRTATACGPCSSAVRNRYFRGKLMTVADYQAEQRYMIQRRRLTNRCLHGWGIVSGFEVRLHEGGLRIEKGVAIDGAGRELVACERVTIAEADDLLWLREDERGLQPGEPLETGEYVLSAYYCERDVDGVRVLEGCDEHVCESNHVCEDVVYALRRRGECPLPFLAECEHDTNDGNVPGAMVEVYAESPRLAPPGDKGADNLCRGIVEKSCRRPFDPCCEKPLVRFGRLRLDPEDGIPLAIVEVTVGRCAFVVGKIHEILRDCALTRIADVGWRDFLPYRSSTISFATFAAMFVAPENDKASLVDTAFWIRLTGPVQLQSLTPDIMTITLVQRTSAEALGKMHRVPILGLWADRPCPGDPPDTTRRFRPWISARFWNGEIGPRDTSSFDRRTLVEIEVRTDRIIDWFGREVAGGGREVPSRDTAPGGRFLSSIYVEPRPASGNGGE